MTRPRLLDLFCGAGGAAVGYARAGFEVVGVDRAERLNYPFERRVADAIEYLDAGGWLGSDAIHASPPCQRWSQGRNAASAKWRRTIEHPDLIAPVRDRLARIGIPYVIENVERAPLVEPIRLCGSMFGLGTADRSMYLRRHRLFELSWRPFVLTPPCAHPADRPAISVFGAHGGGGFRRDGRGGPRGSSDQWREAMGITWMRSAEVAQAIPPAYTEFVGQLLMIELRGGSITDAEVDRILPPAWGDVE